MNIIKLFTVGIFLKLSTNIKNKIKQIRVFFDIKR